MDDQVQAESPAPVINLPWTITAHECNARATTPQTGSIIGRIALECRDGQKAWAFAEQRTRAYEENRARFKKIADDFKSSEAMKGYLNLRAKLSEVEEKITTEETAALKLAPEVQNAIRAAENPGPLRGKLERHKQEALRLRENIVEVDSFAAILLCSSQSLCLCDDSEKSFSIRIAEKSLDPLWWRAGREDSKQPAPRQAATRR